MARLREQDVITALGVEQDAIAYRCRQLARMGAGGDDRMVRKEFLIRDPQADAIVTRLDPRDFAADDLSSAVYNSLGEREGELLGTGNT
jgi:hypothetical protein